jgi:hypothetical protein
VLGFPGLFEVLLAIVFTAAFPVQLRQRQRLLAALSANQELQSALDNVRKQVENGLDSAEQCKRDLDAARKKQGSTPASQSCRDTARHIHSWKLVHVLVSITGLSSHALHINHRAEFVTVREQKARKGLYV